MIPAAMARVHSNGLGVAVIASGQVVCWHAVVDFGQREQAFVPPEPRIGRSHVAVPVNRASINPFADRQPRRNSTACQCLGRCRSTRSRKKYRSAMLLVVEYPVSFVTTC